MATLAEQVKTMEKRLLKADGSARSDTSPEQLEKLEELREELLGKNDQEPGPAEPKKTKAKPTAKRGPVMTPDGMEFPDDARIEGSGRRATLNVNGRTVLR